jgi:hypothetical protein
MDQFQRFQSMEIEKENFIGLKHNGIIVKWIDLIQRNINTPIPSQ